MWLQDVLLSDFFRQCSIWNPVVQFSIDKALNALSRTAVCELLACAACLLAILSKNMQHCKNY